MAVIGYHMINGNHSPSYKGMEQQAVNSDPMSIAISPLAMPLFAGPGTITTALSLANGVLAIFVVKKQVKDGQLIVNHCINLKNVLRV